MNLGRKNYETKVRFFYNFFILILCFYIYFLFNFLNPVESVLLPSTDCCPTTPDTPIGVVMNSGITGESTTMKPQEDTAPLTANTESIEAASDAVAVQPIRFDDDRDISPPTGDSGVTLPSLQQHVEPAAVDPSLAESEPTCADTDMVTNTSTTSTPYLEKSAETVSMSMTATFNDGTNTNSEGDQQKQTTAGGEKTTSTVEQLLVNSPEVDAFGLSPNSQNVKHTSLVMITQDQPTQVNVVTSDMTRFVGNSHSPGTSGSPENPSIVVRHTNREADSLPSADNSLAGYFTHALATDDGDGEPQQVYNKEQSGTLERRRTVKITPSMDYVAATTTAAAANKSDVSCKSEVEFVSEVVGGGGSGSPNQTSSEQLKMCSSDESDNNNQKSSVSVNDVEERLRGASVCVSGGGGRGTDDSLCGAEDVTVVTGANTLSAVIGVHEDGLADDDSWVEDSSQVDDEEEEDEGTLLKDGKLMDEDFGSSETDSDLDYNDGTVPLMCTAVDREGDLRGYNRTAIDFTLHTIVEESCEESEVEPSTPSHHKNKSRVSASELEKYFFYGIAGGSDQNHQSRQFNSFDSTATATGREESMSETSSVVSEDLDSLNGPEHHQHGSEMAADLASSRLEKYFLSGFMGFSGERNDSDGSGSVGSDSEGRPSPEQRRKRLVRARGSGRSHSNSLDNLLSPAKEDENAAADSSALHEANDSSETDTCDETVINLDKSENLSDTLKRKKQQIKKGRFEASTESDKRDQHQSQSSAMQLSDPSDEDGKKTPQPEYLLPPGATAGSLVHSRKQHSRDSGFIGSNDDLLQNGESSSSKTPELKLELAEIEEENRSDVQQDADAMQIPGPSQATVARKDSFNNWSSDEETNVMMSRMRQFFKTLVAASANANSAQSGSSMAASKSSTPNVSGANTPKNGTPVPKSRNRSKPPQLVYFESELTRLMKTVPGINDDQVREIVEYLSSEDTWSDSYDSSDYTSSDLEGTAAKSPHKLELQQQISASCQQIINKFEKIEHDEEGDIGDGGLVTVPRAPSAQGMNETAVVYQRLMASLNKYTKADEKPVPPPGNSPPLFAKVMQHIGTRLVALMHEVSSGESHASSSSPRSANRYHRRLHAKISATTTEDDDSTNEGTGQDQSPGTILNLPRSKSHDLLLGDPKPLHHMSSSGVSDTVTEEKESDYERFSWRGSFESALLADSRSKLSVLDHTSSATSLAAKRRSAGDLLFNQKSMSREQLDRVRSCGSIGGGADHDESELWENEAPTGSRRRSSVAGGVCNSDNGSTSEEEHKVQNRSTLPRSLQSNATVTSSSTNSLPRLSSSALASAAIQKSQSVYQFLQNNVKSARYRAPGFSRPSSSASSSSSTTTGATSSNTPTTSPMNKKSLSVPGLSQNIVPSRRNRKNQNNFSCGELEFSFLEEWLRSVFRGGGYFLFSSQQSSPASKSIVFCRNTLQALAGSCGICVW